MTETGTPAENRMEGDAGEAATAENASRDGRVQPLRPKAEPLVDVESDTLMLHTREAYWMFVGRSWDRDRRPILGGRSAAASLNALRHLAVGGNPYADWFLVCFEEQLAAYRRYLAVSIRELEAKLDALRARGLILTVLASRAPLAVPVAFGSAYGYAIAETMIDFDDHVRLVKTLVLKNRLSAAEGRATTRAVGRILRHLFVRVATWERQLREAPWRALRHADFLPSADESARQRVREACERFGRIPESVLSGTLLPRHAARRPRSGDGSAQPAPVEAPVTVAEGALL